MIMVIKKSLINYALEHAQDAHLKELEKYVQEDSALLFSDDDLFEISAFLSENKSPAKARIGQLAPEDISIDAGPTELIPGPDISALGAVGLKVKVENGKISITEPHILLKKDEEITEAKASILAKLDIEPFKIGLEPVSGFFDGKVYTNVKIDKEATLEELKSFAGKSISFGVSLNYITNDTLSYLLGKAGSHEKALAGLIKEESKEEKPVEEKKDEKPAEEEKGKVEEENKGESQNK
jgi:large subunit ribosomal protein L10